MDEKEFNEFLQWEFTLAGQSADVWAVAASALLRSADLLWQRAMASAQLWAEGFTPGENGFPVATGRRLVGEEIELFGDREVDRPAILLLGYAVENLAKSILVQRTPGLVTPDGEYAGPSHHDLVSLVSDCGIKVSKSEADCLATLTDYVEWLGRYPIPKSYKKGRSARGAWVWHRTKPRHEIWDLCRPIAGRLLVVREAGRPSAPLPNDR